jgi:hypothetical protein
MLHKINLLRYFDKSFSEIYQIEHGEILHENDEVLDKDLEDNEHKAINTRLTSRKRYNLALYFLMGLVLLGLIAGSFVYYKVYTAKEELSKKQTLKQTQKQAIPMDNTAKTESNEAKDTEFKKIGEILFLEETPENTNQTSKAKGITDNQHKNITKGENIKQSYTIIIEKVYEGELDNIKLSLPEYKVNLETHLKERTKMMVYKAYKYTDKSKTYIGKKPVVYVGSFYDKTDAINFLRSLLQTGVITSKMEDVSVYEVKISGFKSEPEISSFVNKLNLKNKNVKIE